MDPNIGVDSRPRLKGRFTGSGRYRALVMVLDDLGPDAVERLELATGVPLVYGLNPDTTVAEKEVLSPAEPDALPRAKPRP